MTTFDFKPADAVADRDALIDINTEYMSWVSGEIEKHFGISSQSLMGMSVLEYVTSVIDSVVGEPPPRGAFYLVWVDGELGGMGGFRRVEDGVAEFKRIYVRPNQRGRNLGQVIVQRLLADARAFGYKKIRLDTAPFMHSAQRIYQAEGFVDRGPYAGSEVPSALHSAWRFMERSL